ncbi:hypothetical protein TPHA_0M00970 [Tetrapisispora phaffii CBS 4417]|uniref:Vacuolar protein sorting-associated protein 54 C-terminal domain-containing protein n=1 Tax=Tetrapisispora phaffii (strain ATCC 24235 / CBS 4417 / NBRC 1672 / NRRL Y-8282 / UCD 70-5) TaxID=1071381 RepID=G8C0F6_TETPH|nr:hypothetical protein TPHA_0M00970 [Tetrapisispora phaffii CBS 4417]CCE65671.1 hypothetical protein TPHA_0M00970 [Tetrapisispora phaffii CBS 4417]
MDPSNIKINKSSTIEPNSSGSYTMTDVNGEFIQPPKIIEPTSMDSTLGEDDETSLNDDILSISESTKNKHLSRMSLDSASVRKSFESSIAGRSSRTFGFGHGIHSGSQDFSPLGNNSIYEIVMNTRRKNWLGFPTSYDIPPVTLSKNEIEKNWKADIKNYIESVKQEYLIFESTNNLKNMNRLEQIKQLEDYNNNDETQTKGKNEFNDTINDQQQGNMFAKDLGQVPEFYFDKDFQLDNPRIFHKVLDGLRFNLTNVKVSENTDREEEFNQINERLNDYLDAVEGLLVTEISKSSHKFYHALSNVDQIQDKVKNSIQGLDKISDGLIDIDKNKIQKEIEKLQNMIKQKNIEKLEQGLLQVKAILVESDNCKKLFQEEKFDECMTLINTVNKLVKGDKSDDPIVQKITNNWPHDLVDLRAVPSLSETREYLTNMNIEIGGKFSLQLCDILMKDLQNYCKTSDTNEVLDRLQNKTRSRRYLEISKELQDSITVLIDKLFKCEELTSSFSFFQDKLITELKTIIKLYLPNEKKAVSNEEADTSISLENSPNPESLHNSKGTQENNAVPQPKQTSSGTKLSKLIKEQTSEEFQQTLLHIFTHASEALRRLYRYQKMLLDTSLNEIISANDPNINEYDMITQLDIRNGINEGIKIIQLRMGKIIIVRRDISSQLSYSEFLKLYAIVVCFIQECEEVSGEFLTKYLSDVLESQIQAYINFQNVKNSRLLREITKKDAWLPYIVEPTVQRDVNDILVSMDIDPLDWTNELQLVKAKSSNRNNEVGEKELESVNGDNNSGNGNNTAESNTASVENNDGVKVTKAHSNSDNNGVVIPKKPVGHRKSVVVGDKTFVASESLITIIGKIKEIMILSIDLPSVYLPNFERNISNLLEAFNANILRIFSEDKANSIQAQNPNPDQLKPSVNRNYSIIGESLDCLVEFIKVIQKFYRRLMSSSKDFNKKKNATGTTNKNFPNAFPSQHNNSVDYIQLLQLYQSTIEKIYLANAPPPPA